MLKNFWLSANLQKELIFKTYQEKERGLFWNFLKIFTFSLATETHKDEKAEDDNS